MSWESGSYDAAAAASIGGVLEGVESVEEGDDWVEAEIERLLQGAIDHGEEKRLQNIVHVPVKDQHGDECVSNLFATYLSTVGAQQSDMQALLSDGYTTLAAANDAVMTTSLTTSYGDNSTKQICDDVQYKLSNKESDASETIAEMKPDQSQTSSYTTEYIVKETLTDTHAEQCCVPTSIDTHLSPIEGMTDRQRLQTRKSTELNDVGFSLCQDQHMVLSQEPVGVCREVCEVLDQLQTEQRRSEEQLAKNQREREAELTTQIEEAHKMIAEYQRNKFERMKRSEHLRHQSAVTIQAYWRGCIVRRTYHNELLYRKQIRLQRTFGAAQLLQAFWRGFSVRRCYAPVLEAKRVMRLQKEAMTRNISATRIQTRWRGYWARHVYGPALAVLKENRISESLIIKEEMHKKSVIMATIIQGTWRGYLARKMYRLILNKRMNEWRKERDIRSYNAASKLQAYWKGHSVRQRVRPLLQELSERRTFEKQQEKAAVVLQALWRGHSCRVRYQKQRHDNQNIHNEIQQTSEDPSLSSIPRPGNKLTVEKRLQSALKFKMQHSKLIADLSLSDNKGCTSTYTCSNEDGIMQGSLSGEDRPDLDKEQNALVSLTTSRRQEEAVAEQSRVRMSHTMTRSDAEKALQEKQSHSSYQIKLKHASTSLQPQEWLDIVRHSLHQWALSMTPWKEPQPPDHVPTTLIPKARVKQTVKPLSKVEVLAATPKDTPLNEVTKVVVCNSPTVPDVGSLSVCQKLCSLSLISCNLAVLISPHLPLVELMLKSNILEQVDLEDVYATLRFLDLSENRLCTIHGMDKCSCLLYLDISGNRITRLGGLRGCWHLQSLKADANLLVCCPELENLPYLQILSCTENHIPSLPGLHNCSLLTSLQLRQNNLQEIPRLPHHVVLRELRLDENSLTSISPLCQAWLPLLQILSVAGNCITQLESLVHLLMLHTLDISNNSIYDLALLLQSVQGCMELRSISLLGNPVGEEPEVYSSLLSILPSLEIVNESPLHELQKCQLSDLVTSSTVYKLCKRQLSEQDNMKRTHNTSIEMLQNADLHSPQDVERLLEMKVDHCKQYEHLLVTHIREQEELGRQCLLESSEKMMESNIERSSSNVPDINQRRLAAVVLQSAWRGQVVRHSLAALHSSVVGVQAAWRGVLIRQKVQTMKKSIQKQCWAATIIQAVYRGHWVRCKLQDLIQCTNDTDDSLEEDIDLNLLDYNILEDNMSPLSPSSPPGIHTTQHFSGHSFYSHLHSISAENEDLQCSTTAAEVPLKLLQAGGTGAETKSPPAEAWSEDNVAISLPITSSLLAHDETVKKTNKEKIATEWGFKTDATTHMLLKRAKRQKKFRTQAEKRKKMADPVKRLAAFQKQSQSATGDVTLQSCGHHRQSSEHTHQRMTSMMYQWCHDHRVIHKDSLDVAKASYDESETMEFSRAKKEAPRPSSIQDYSECSLPQLDHRVLAGHAPTLVACGTTDKSFVPPSLKSQEFQGDPDSLDIDSCERLQ